MKKIALIFLFSVSTSIYAQDTKTVPKSEWCSVVAELAGAIMSSRQSGVELDKVLSLSNKIGENDPRLKDIANQMAIEAYSENSYISEKMQKRSTTEFKNKWQLDCIKS